MADVMGAFLRGREFAQAENEHTQALEENKLRTSILKHQIDGMKIEDKLRARALQQQNLEMMQGQPEASLPHEQVAQPNLPSTSLAGSSTGLPAGGASFADPSTAAASSSFSPNAQSPYPGSNMTSRIKPMTISGVPEWGVGDTQIAPRSMEDIIRASVAAKMMEPYNLGRGQTRMLGQSVVAQGEPFPAPRPTRASLALEANKGDAVAANNDLKSQSLRTGQMTEVQNMTLDGEPTPMLKDTKGNFYDLDKNPIENAGTRVKQAVRTSTNAAAQAETANRAEYAAYTRLWNRKYPSMSATERADAKSRAEFDSKFKMPPEPPNAPTYDKWKVMTSAERQDVLNNPGNRITDAEMSARQSTAKQPSNGGQSAAAAPTKGKQAKTFTQQQVEGYLAGKARGKRYTMLDGPGGTLGSMWDLLPDGSVKFVGQSTSSQ